MNIKTKAQLKSELHKLGIKTYRNKKTNASYVKRGDVKKILAYDEDEDLLDVYIDVEGEGVIHFYKENPDDKWESTISSGDVASWNDGGRKYDSDLLPGGLEDIVRNIIGNSATIEMIDDDVERYG